MKDQATTPAGGWLDRLTAWKIILVIILCFGLYATVVRFAVKFHEPLVIGQLSCCRIYLGRNGEFLDLRPGTFQGDLHGLLYLLSYDVLSKG